MSELEAFTLGTVASTNPALSSLLQTLASASPELSSALSPPAVQSALQNASASDIVQLSDQALQLQTTDLLFGTPGTSDPSSLFSTLLAPAGSSPATSLTNPLAAYQSNLQVQEMQALFGIDTQSTTPSTPFNILA